MDGDQRPTSEFMERISAYRTAEENAYVPPPPEEPRQKPLLIQYVRRSFFTVLLLFVAIQAVPYGRDHTNPPITEQPNWDSQATWQMASRACFDCHSNTTAWPWYSYVAPVSWVIQHDVAEGRGKMNFSEWDQSQRTAREAGKDVRDGKMPLWYYVLTHPDARLTPQQAHDFAAGLDATIGRKR